PGLFLRVCRDDDLGRPRLEHLDRIAHGVRGIRVDDETVGGNPGLTELRQRALEPPTRGRAPRVLVDDVTGMRIADRREHGHEIRLPARDGVDQVRPRHGLVRDDQYVPHGDRASSSSCSRAPLNTACRAPGTPYSYGPPTICGISSKLKTGGGEDTCHSSVIACHGFASATGPRIQLTIAL